MLYKVKVQDKEFVVNAPGQVYHMQAFALTVDDCEYELMWNKQTNIFFVKEKNIWKIFPVSEIERVSDSEILFSGISKALISLYHPGLKRAVVKQNLVETLSSPLSGKVIKAPLVGERVKKGQTLFVIDAMKMENQIDSPLSGSLSQVLKAKGSLVKKGDVLVRFS
jgi:acetyl/propionyl-CoA carboxylase alpha subunit